MLTLTFTSHYVSINSTVRAYYLHVAVIFTSHYVSINSVQGKSQSHKAKTFTSHYVSINSYINSVLICNFNHLHPTMYLLILFAPYCFAVYIYNLHPTMYLLIRQEVINLKTDCIIYIPLCIY